jgi:hypothetical protein
MFIDEYTATKNPNINKFSGHPVIPLKIKNHNVALPILTDRIKKNNLKNYEKLFISSIINNKKYKSKCNDFFKFYHPWLSYICKNEEINSFMSYCYDITKVTPPPVKINKIKINNIKYNNKENKKVERNYRIINDINKNKFKNISVSVGTNTNFLEKKPQKRYISIENNNESKEKYKYFNPLNESINNAQSFRNSYLTLKKKGFKKNSTLLNSEYTYNDTFGFKNNRSSSLNNSNFSISNSTMKAEYKTIKIKKVKNNERPIDRKMFRDTFRIESKFNYC